MKLKLRVTSLILIFLFMQTFLVKLPVYAVDAAKELKIGSELTQWVLDESNNNLYAISETGKNLMFINSASMVVEKTLSFNEGPTDIIKDNGKLYIALDKANQIAVVDISSRTIVETINTSSDPYRIVKDEDNIYYTQLDQHCMIYEYNLTLKIDKVISAGTVYQPDIAINPSNHILYIGESGSSGSELIYYSTATGKIVARSNYNDGYGFPSPKRSVLFDGTNLYYAGRDFSADNPTRFNGDYSSDGYYETVLYVNSGLVYTNRSIYNKDTHAKLGDYGYEPSLVTASNNTLYIYNKNTGSIKSYNDSNKVINTGNVIALISGNPAAPVQTATESVKINSGMNTLEMNSKLIQWVLDESSNTLYGISQESKALFFINAATLELEKSLTFASSPTDIIVDQGKLYVALDDANQIVIMDTASRTITGRLYTSSDPYRLVKGGDKVYYTERDQWCYIYEYNLETNTDRKLNMNPPKLLSSGRVYQPDLAINTEDQLLYVGESGGTGSKMLYYSLVDDKVISVSNYSNGYGFSNAKRIILFDGKKVYYAGFDFDKKDPTRILGSYDDDVIFVKYGVAYTETGIYDTETNTLVQYTGGGIDLYEISQQSVTYYYSKEENSILSVDPSKIAFVEFDSQGGSEVDYLIADINSLIKAPVAPERAGYRFDGWYKEAECINPWNFSTDKVTANTTLYAKWTIGNFAVNFNPNGGSSVSGQTVVGANKVVKPADPTRPGYNFGGWFIDQYAFTKTFDFNSSLANDINLYAKWVPTEAYIYAYIERAKQAKLFGVYNEAKAVIFESDLPEARKIGYLVQLAQLDPIVFTDLNKYFIYKCNTLAANPNLTDFLAAVDEINTKISNEIDRGYFLGQLASWGHYRVYTPQVQASIAAIGKVWTDKTPESVTEARAAIATVKEAGSVTWLTGQLEGAIQFMDK